jgi:hypothetical protein
MELTHMSYIIKQKDSLTYRSHPMKEIKLVELDHDCCAVCENYSELSCSINCPDKTRDCDECQYYKKHGIDDEYNIYLFNKMCPYVKNPHHKICEGDNFKRRSK